MRISLLAALFLSAFVGLSGCVQPFSERLAQTSSAALTEREARSFFLNSPFCARSSASFYDVSGPAQPIDVSACWVSSYFRERRRQLITRFGARWTRTKPSASPAKPAWQLAAFIPGPLLIPSDPAQALHATRRLGLSPAPGTDFELDLNEEWGQGDAIQLDVAIRPASGLSGCLATLLGQIAARGLSLVRADGAERQARRWTVLGLGENDKTLVIRAWFARNETSGAPWLGDFPQRATLKISLPKGAAETCPGRNPLQPIRYETQIRFDLAAIRRFAHAY